jgi:CHASE3 domain sensor protein
MRQKLDFLEQVIEEGKRDPQSLVKNHHPKVILENQEDIKLSKDYATQQEVIMSNKVLVTIGLAISLGLIISQHSNVLFS